MSAPAGSLARTLFELFQAREWDAARELLVDDVVFEWPHSADSGSPHVG